MIFKDTLKQEKYIFSWDPTIIIVLVNGIHHLNSYFPLTIRFRTWLTRSQQGVLHTLTANPKSCSMFAHSPFSCEGKSIGNLLIQCNLHFLSLIFPVFPIAERKQQIQLPFSFLLLQRLAAVAVWQRTASIWQLGRMAKGRRRLETGTLSREAVFGQAAVCPQSAPACTEGLRAVLPGHTLQVGREGWGPILSCCSAPLGQCNMVLLSSGEELSLTAN